MNHRIALAADVIETNVTDRSTRFVHHMTVEEVDGVIAKQHAAGMDLVKFGEHKYPHHQYWAIFAKPVEQQQYLESTELEAVGYRLPWWLLASAAAGVNAYIAGLVYVILH